MKQTLRNQQDLLKNRKKVIRKRRFVRFLLFLVLILVLLFLGFYSISNPGFFGNIINTVKSFYSSGPVEPSNSSETNITAEGSSTETASESTAAGGESVSADKSGTEVSFWEKILSLLKIGIKKQEKNFPSSLVIKVYFATLGEEEKFVFEKRTIVAGEPGSAVKNAIYELLKGPYKSFNYAVIPPGTKLLGVEIYENFAKINFSGEFLENSLESGILDEYVIYSIVNTVTQVPGIDGVIFLIDGKRIKVYGNIDLSIPAIKNEKFLEESEST
jgi:spore germination protein GerM